MEKQQTMYYVRTGNPKGQAILFLHALGTSGQMWSHIIPVLQKDFNCIVVDLPGHGLSRNIPWLSLADTALQLKKIIEKETMSGRAHLAGLSFGAYAGLTLLRRYPECVESAFLSGINVLPLPHPMLMKVLVWLISKVLKTDLMIGMNARSLNIPEADQPAYRLSVKQLDIPSYQTANAEALDFRIPESRGDLYPPVLFMAGEKEHPLVLATLTKLLENIPGSQACLIKGLGHGWSAEDPELFAQALECWVNKVQLPESLSVVNTNDQEV